MLEKLYGRKRSSQLPGPAVLRQSGERNFTGGDGGVGDGGPRRLKKPNRERDTLCG